MQGAKTNWSPSHKAHPVVMSKLSTIWFVGSEWWLPPNRFKSCLAQLYIILQEHADTHAILGHPIPMYLNLFGRDLKSGPTCKWGRNPSIIVSLHQPVLKLGLIRKKQQVVLHRAESPSQGKQQDCPGQFLSACESHFFWCHIQVETSWKLLGAPGTSLVLVSRDNYIPHVHIWIHLTSYCKTFHLGVTCYNSLWVKSNEP